MTDEEKKNHNCQDPLCTISLEKTVEEQLNGICGIFIAWDKASPDNITKERRQMAAYAIGHFLKTAALPALNISAAGARQIEEMMEARVRTMQDLIRKGRATEAPTGSLN